MNALELVQLPMYKSEEFNYELTPADIASIKDAMILDGVDANDNYFKEAGLFKCIPPLANIMYVMKERQLIPFETHQICTIIHDKLIRHV